MPCYVALLRGINISGQRIIRMADLRSHFESFGATQVRTYIQRGNVVFQHRARSVPSLKRPLETQLGYAVSTLANSITSTQAVYRARRPQQPFARPARHAAAQAPPQSDEGAPFRAWQRPVAMDPALRPPPRKRGAFAAGTFR